MISIILPTYNSAPWLRACVESVVAQTVTDWELIAIDDGSTDGSATILESMVKRDKRIRLIRSGHNGVAYVRNVGIAEARGELVAFIDSDDLWPSDSLALLLDMLTENKADISSGAFIYCDDSLQAEKNALAQCRREGAKKDASVKIMSGEEAVRESLYQRNVNSSLCGKLFRRSLFRELKMMPGELYEDLDLFYRVALNARCVAVSPLPVYIYRQRSGSIIHTFSTARLDVLEVTRRMHEFIAAEYPQLEKAALDRRFAANFNMLQEISRYLLNGSPSARERDIFDERAKEIRAFLRTHAIKELKNPDVRLKNKAGALLYLALPQRVMNLILSKS